MAHESNFLAAQRYAVVTGSNKGIGFEICKQLASNGVMVVLTARDEKRGLEAVQKLKQFAGSGLSDVIFHQLDVANPDSVASLADFIRTQFGKLDILVNNAGIGGAVLDAGLFGRASQLSGGGWPKDEHAKWEEILTQTYEMGEDCLNTNYYGAKRMVESLIPLLQLSDSARIVNVSSMLGQLKNIPSEQTKAVLNDIENLTEERLDEMLNKFLKDFKDGSLEKEGWPTYLSGYIASKAAMNAYTRVLAKKYPNIMINSVCPGFVKTDITCNNGMLTPAEGAQSPVRLALLPSAGPSGFFFHRSNVTSF